MSLEEKFFTEEFGIFPIALLHLTMIFSFCSKLFKSQSLFSLRVDEASALTVLFLTYDSNCLVLFVFSASFSNILLFWTVLHTFKIPEIYLRLIKRFYHVLCIMQYVYSGKLTSFS